MRIDKCKKCNAPIVWLKKRNGKWMCVDAETYKDGEIYQHGVHSPHWATCPYAQDFHAKPETTVDKTPPLTDSEKRARGIIDNEKTLDNKG